MCSGSDIATVLLAAGLDDCVIMCIDSNPVECQGLYSVSDMNLLVVHAGGVDQTPRRGGEERGRLE